MCDETAEGRARRGAEFLDVHRPGWATEINPNRLAMSECSMCILGQLYGHFQDGLEELGGPLDAIALGFDSENRHAASSYLALADAWRDEVKARVDASNPQTKGAPHAD